MTDSYENFAEFYDQGASTNISEKVALLKQKIKQLNPNATSILELACGTGNILVELAGEFEVVGLDLSPSMLKVAQRKAPNAELHIADMTNFNLGRKFDAIICIFDSINHLLSFEQWEAAFKQAKKHLNADGVFLFDVNTIKKLEDFSRLPASQTEFETGYQIAKITSENSGVYNWNLEVHIPQDTGNEKIIQNVIPEVAFPIERILAALKLQFNTTEMFTPDGATADEEAYRVYFACKV